MRINSAIPKVNFNAIYKIKVDKDIFSYPDNALACKEQFRNDIFPRLDDFVSYKHGLYMTLESFGYEFSLKNLESNGLGYCSVNWLNQNTLSNIRTPEDKNFHTFCIFTDKDAMDISKKIDMSKLKLIKLLTKLSKDLLKGKIKGNLHSDFVLRAKFAEVLDKIMSETIDKDSIKLCLVNKCDEDLKNKKN